MLRHIYSVTFHSRFAILFSIQNTIALRFAMSGKKKGNIVKPVKRVAITSVMFDPEAAIWSFPPKPVPLSMDEK